jgi:hypothetical protein
MVFPGMFFSPLSAVYPKVFISVFVLHVVIVEPVYYAAHRWLHYPANMAAMHGKQYLATGVCVRVTAIRGKKRFRV